MFSIKKIRRTVNCVAMGRNLPLLMIVIAFLPFAGLQVFSQQKEQKNKLPLRAMPMVNSVQLMNARWTQEQAYNYMHRFGVVKGCNYVPRYNGPWWSDFREDVIREELGWARDIGLNSVRVFVSVSA